MQLGKRFYLDCQYDEKELCKNLGARWDMDKKMWFVPKELDLEDFKRWHPTDERNEPQGKFHVIK